MNWFTHRKAIEAEYKKWLIDNGVADSAFNVISFLEGKNMLKEVEQEHPEWLPPSP